ncbi:MAG: ribosome small subunit-dependent GTPase A [Melioribacteraceae bacterium]|nr:ribosome small subunit-dependent GTPase A [Melioribacteraceae bacterium]
MYKIESKDYYLINEEGEIIRSVLRGKFKKTYGFKKDKLHTLDIVAVGDYVNFQMNDDGTGWIDKVFERNNYLSRKAPKIKGTSFRGERLEQIIATNVNKLFIVNSTIQPQFNNRLLDRIIVGAESAKIEPVIIINKIDLIDIKEAEYWIDIYQKCGYKVYLTSAKKKIGIENLRLEIKNSDSVFWGASGVGKSSLLNTLYPELNFKVGEISTQTNKGTHTTVTSVLKEVEPGTIIVDTPGIREIEPYGIKKQDLGHYYIEFSDYLNDCKFNTCTHFHEPGCIVREAVENGDISEERYESYLNLLDTIEDDMIY